jgi:predicted nucleotidyltransferase
MPQSLTTARDAVLQRFASACQDDARIEAAFLGGSNAAGTADAFSDLDLYVIAADEDYDALFADRDVLLCKLGEPLFREDFDGFGVDMLVFILDDGVDGELVLERASGIVQIYGGPFLPIIDRAGLLRDRTFPIQRPTDADVAAELHVVLAWFWKDMTHFIRAIARDRLWTAFLFLEKLRGCCSYLVTTAQAPPASPMDHFVPFEGYEALDRMSATPELALMRATFGPLDRATLLAAARTLVEVYQRLGPSLAARYGLSYPDRLATVVLTRLAALDTAPGIT